MHLWPTLDWREICQSWLSTSTTGLLIMDEKKFVIATTCCVTKTTWIGLTDVSWSKVAWLSVSKRKMSSLWEIIARDYVFSVKIAEGGGGLGYLNKFNLKKTLWNCNLIPKVVFYSKNCLVFRLFQVNSLYRITLPGTFWPDVGKKKKILIQICKK